MRGRYGAATVEHLAAPAANAARSPSPAHPPTRTVGVGGCLVPTHEYVACPELPLILAEGR